MESVPVNEIEKRLNTLRECMVGISIGVALELLEITKKELLSIIVQNDPGTESIKK